VSVFVGLFWTPFLLNIKSATLLRVRKKMCNHLGSLSTRYIWSWTSVLALNGMYRTTNFLRYFLACP
jgi:hypothetical protein